MKKITGCLGILLLLAALAGCSVSAAGQTIEETALPSQENTAQPPEETPESVSVDIASQSAEPTAEPEALPTDTETSSTEAQATDECEAQGQPTRAQALSSLAVILSDLSGNYYEGTAGSSLKAAMFAGALLDWYGQYNSLCDIPCVSDDEIAAAASSFYDKLPSEAAAALPSQLEAVYAMAGELTGADAKELLLNAGYTSAYAPYTQERIDALFSALFSGVGLSLPQ